MIFGDVASVGGRLVECLGAKLALVDLESVLLEFLFLEEFLQVEFSEINLMTIAHFLYCSGLVVVQKDVQGLGVVF